MGRRDRTGDGAAAPPHVWIRRFESEEQRVALYAAVYETSDWKDEIAPTVGTMLDRSRTVITRIAATPKSVIQ